MLKKSSILRFGLASLAVVGALAMRAPTAIAGTGGSADAVRDAVASGSTDAILAEVERVERLVCADCVEPITALLDDSRYPVRQVAAWWFAKRPALKTMMTGQMRTDLGGTDSTKVTYAADYLSTVASYDSIPDLVAAYARAGLTVDARLHIVQALGVLGHSAANSAITSAMSDSDPTVRSAALDSWQAVLYQHGAAPAVALLADSDAHVRAKAASVIGGFREASARTALEAMVTTDADAPTRRNAAWALGRIGNTASTTALTTATNDASSLVRTTAKVALSQLH